jgi:hypothetical protein
VPVLLQELIVAPDIIVSDLVPLRERGNFLAIILAVFGVGTSFGPFIGGAIVEVTTWRWAFWINLPIGGISLAVMYLFLHVQYDKEMSLAEKLRRIDLIGNGILTASAVAILYALTYAGTVRSWSSWKTLIPLSLGLLGLALFPLYEIKGSAVEPVTPPRIFHHRTSKVVIVNTFLIAMVYYWFLYFLPVYFQAVRVYSPRLAGVSLLPQSLAGVPGAAIAALCLSKWGKFKLIHFIGFCIATLGIGLFSIQDEQTHIAGWVVFQCICALGVGMILETLLPAFQAPALEADQAAATSTWAFVRSFGCIWGVAVPASVFNSFVDRHAHLVTDPSVRDQLLCGRAYERASAAFIESFPLETRSEIRAVYRIALQRVFQVGVAFAGLATLLVLLERHVPLRKELETEYGLQSDARDVTGQPATADDSSEKGPATRADGIRN